MKPTLSERKRINLKAVVILAVAAVVCTLTVYLVHGFQVQRNSEGLLAQAHLFKKTGKDRLAIQSLERYLGLVPEDTKSLAKFGLWLDEVAFNASEKARAYLVLKHVLRRNDQLEIRRKVAELALEFSLFDEAKANLKVLEKNNSMTVDDIVLLARAESGLGNYAAAAKELCSILYEGTNKTELASKDYELYEQCAYLLRGKLQGKLPQSLKTLIANVFGVEEESLGADQAGNYIVEDMVNKIHQPRKETVLAAARYYHYFGDLEKASKRINSLLHEAGNPDSAVLLLASRIAAGQGLTKEARGYLQEGLRYVEEKLAELKKSDDVKKRDEVSKLEEDSHRVLHALATLELTEGNRPDALDHLNRSFKSPPKRVDQLFKLANLLIDAGEAERTGNIIYKLNSINLSLLSEYLRARKKVKERAWGEAAELLVDYHPHWLLATPLGRTVNLEERINVLLGDCYGALGNPDRQIAAYEKALAVNANWFPAQSALAAAYSGVGKTSAAIHWLKQVVQRAPDQKLRLARELIKLNLQLPKATKRSNEDQIQELLDSLPENENVETKLVRASFHLAKGDLQEAWNQVKSTASDHPTEVEPRLFLVALAEQYAQLKQDPLTILEEAEEEVKDSAEWIIARAALCSKEDADDAIEELNVLAEAIDDSDGAKKNKLLLGLGQAFYKAGGKEKAKELWTLLAERQEKNLAIRFQLFEMAFMAEDQHEAGTWLQELKELEKVGPFTAYGNAAMSLLKSDGTKQENLRQAQEELDRAAGFRPSWSRVPWLKGVVFEFQREKQQALVSYKKAMKLGDHRLILYKRMLELLREQKKFVEANNLLERLPLQVKASDEFYRLFLEVAVFGPSNEADKKHALQVAEKATEESDDYQDYLWLGQMADLANDFAKAEKAYRTARRKAETAFEKKKVTADDLSATWVALVLFLASRDKRQALDELERAASDPYLPKKQIPVVRAPCYELLGEFERAKEQYDLSLAQNPNDPTVLTNVAGFYVRRGPAATAEKLLRKLLRHPKTADATKADTRRTLAIILAKQGYPGIKTGERLIEKNRDSGSFSFDDRQAMALVKAEHPAFRRQAIEELEKLAAEKGALAVGVRYRLAQLYKAVGNWDEAKTQMFLVFEKVPNNAAYLDFFITGLVENEEFLQAAMEVKKLAKLRPKDFNSIALQARVLHGNGQSQRAKQLLLEFANTQRDAPLHFIARVLDDIGFSAEAKVFYDRHIEKSDDPHRYLYLAQFFGRHKRWDEAIAVCKAATENSPPVAVAVTWAELVHQAGNKPAQLQEVADWLKLAVKKHSKQKFLPLVLADIYGYQGKVDRALLMLEKVLAEEPDNVLALNNYAFLLAFEKGRLNEAEESINRAIEKVAGPLSDLLDTRALIRLRQGKASQAIQDLNEAVAQHRSGIACFHLAQAYALDGELRRSKQLFQEALDKFHLTATDLVPAERLVMEALARQLKIKLR